MNDFYTYELAYPQSMGGTVFYVGKGRGRRILDHEPEAKRGHQCNRCEIIRFIQSAGEQVVKRKVSEHLSEVEAFSLEGQMIEARRFETLANGQRGHKNPFAQKKVQSKIIGYRTYSYQKDGMFYQESEVIFEDGTKASV